MGSVLGPQAPLPLLPLLLWETPPGLELILAQEGVPFVRVRDPHPLAFRAGTFVLYDGRRVSSSRVRGTLTPGHIALDVDALRRAEGSDPFAELVDNRASRMAWRAEGLDAELVERASRRDKGAIRRRVVGRLREAIERAGGLWARLASYPFPYRSAFNFRADLDEPVPEDYARFARARRPIEDCTTHFVSTHAYGRDSRVLGDLSGRDVQSHGHFHVVYRDPSANRRNVERAHAVLSEAGFAVEGFAAPEGRWNPGLDRALEGMGYRYSSDFHLGYDDLPFFPRVGDRFSGVLQVPIHPICEGLFLGAGSDGRAAGSHLIRAVRAKIEAGEPAFVYGHPERRLGRFPGVLTALASAIEGEDFLWRVTLTDFARWWRWRADRRWSVVPKGPGRYEVQFDEWDASHPMAMEVLRGDRVAILPVAGPRMPIAMDGLAYERRLPPPALPGPRRAGAARGLRAAVRAALDWETVTPIEELPTGSIGARLKVGLRRWRSRTRSSDREEQACA